MCSNYQTVRVAIRSVCELPQASGAIQMLCELNAQTVHFFRCSIEVLQQLCCISQPGLIFYCQQKRIFEHQSATCTAFADPGENDPHPPRLQG